MELVKLEADKAHYRVVVPNFGVGNKVDSIVIVPLGGDETVYNVDAVQEEFDVVIVPYHSGPCEYSFFSRNSVGRSE